jgi:L-asparaginase II
MPKRSRKRGDEHGLPSLALVFGYIAVKDLQRLEDRIGVLDRLGYGNAEMALICGAKPTTIATLKHRAKSRRTR